MLEKFYQCPFCFTEVSILVDPSIREQGYIEDCERCCRPIEFSIKTNGTEITQFHYQAVEQ